MMAIDDHGIECPNCDHWMYLHWTVLDGVRYETGRCPSCGQLVEEYPADTDTGRKHMSYDDYPGKGEFIVEIRRPNQPIRGCRYDNRKDALDFVNKTPTIPCGSVSCWSVSGLGVDVTRKWPAKDSDLDSSVQGEIDACMALRDEFRHALDYDKPIEPKDLIQWGEETRAVGRSYALRAGLMICHYGDLLEEFLKEQSFEHSAKVIIGMIHEDLRKAEELKEVTA